MAVCKFFLQGNCRFGDKCRFEHPQNSARNTGPASHQNAPRNDMQPRNNQQRFTSPPRTNQRFVDANRHSSRPANHREDQRSYKLMTQDSIEDDMTIERPQWICSAYGPVSGLMPTQLFGGPMEVSFEEARCEYYLAALGGNTQKAQADQESLWTQAQQQIIHVAGNLPAAMKYLRDGANQRPNRADIVREINKLQPNDSRRNTRDFFSRENASRRQKKEEADLRRARLAAPNASANSSITPAHSQAQWGQSQPAPFGNPQQPNGAFGQPQPPQPNNAFGQPPQGPFGAPPQAPNAGTFGQPNLNGQFGAAPQGGNFGTPAANGQFGAPQAASNGGFGQPQQPQGNSDPFGQVQQPQANGNVFGQPEQPNINAFGVMQQPQANGVFGQPATSGGFGIQPQNSFGNSQPLVMQPGGFGNAQPVSSAFNQQQNAPTGMAINESHQAGTTLMNPPGTGGFGHQPSPTQAVPPSAAAPSASQPTKVNATRNPNGSLRTWNGQPVEYKGNIAYYKLPDGQLQRIWFPNGPQQADLDSYGRCVPSEEEYTETAKQTYEQSLKTGEWLEGKIPLMAPRPEWCGWEV